MVVAGWKRGLLALSLVTVASLVANDGYSLVIGGEDRVPLTGDNPLAQRYAASGSIVCDDRFVGGGQLTLAPDLATISGHLLVDPVTCEPRAELTQCLMRFGFGANEQTVPVTRVLATGVQCPDGDNAGKPYRDWAIVELGWAPRGIEPLGLPTYDEERGWVELPATAVSGAGQADFFEINVDGDRVYPSTYQRCQIKNGYLAPEGDAAFMLTDCDTGFGASGSALLYEPSDGPPVLVGIVQGFSRNPEGGLEIDSADMNYRCEYSIPECVASGVFVSGVFYDALLEFAAIRRACRFALCDENDVPRDLSLTLPVDKRKP